MTGSTKTGRPQPIGRERPGQGNGDARSFRRRIRRCTLARTPWDQPPNRSASLCVGAMRAIGPQLDPGLSDRRQAAALSWADRPDQSAGSSPLSTSTSFGFPNNLIRGRLAPRRLDLMLTCYLAHEACRVARRNSKWSRFFVWGTGRASPASRGPANLDAKLRIISASRPLYVTHDQIEAMTLAHRVALIEKGVVQ